MKLVAALAALLLVQVVHAHVLLTYPLARYPQYDYLDNYRKGGPCGVAGKQLHVEIVGSTVGVAYYSLYVYIVF